MKMPPVNSSTILYVALGVVSIAAFAMSFRALAELAERNEMAFPALFPCIIDLAALACAVASYQAGVTGREEPGYRALVVAFTLCSGILNVSHVWAGPEWAHVLKYAMHCLPPLVSFAVFEVLLSEVRHGREAGISSPVAPRQRTEPATDGTPERTAQPGRRGRKPGSRTATDENGQPITRKEMARRSGIPLRSLYRHLARNAA